MTKIKRFEERRLLTEHGLRVAYRGVYERPPYEREVGTDAVLPNGMVETSWAIEAEVELRDRSLGDGDWEVKVSSSGSDLDLDEMTAKAACLDMAVKKAQALRRRGLASVMAEVATTLKDAERGRIDETVDVSEYAKRFHLIEEE